MAVLESNYFMKPATTNLCSITFNWARTFRPNAAFRVTIKTYDPIEVDRIITEQQIASYAERELDTFTKFAGF